MNYDSMKWIKTHTGFNSKGSGEGTRAGTANGVCECGRREVSQSEKFVFPACSVIRFITVTCVFKVHSFMSVVDSLSLYCWCWL